jgi:RNA polymerase sigma-70 factor, ECF subfamily
VRAASTLGPGRSGSSIRSSRSSVLPDRGLLILVEELPQPPEAAPGAALDRSERLADARRDLALGQAVEVGEPDHDPLGRRELPERRARTPGLLAHDGLLLAGGSEEHVIRQAPAPAPLGTEEVDGAAVDEYEEPRLRPRATGPVAIGGSPEREKRFLHGILRERVISQDPSRHAECDSAVTGVQLGERVVVAGSETLDQLLHVKLETPHVRLLRDSTCGSLRRIVRSVSVREVTGRSEEEARAEARLVTCLRLGDSAAFAEIVVAWSSPMMRLALVYVSSRSVAEEVVQEAWLSVVRSLDGFAGRSSLKTWVFVILANTAKRRAKREARSVPFSSVPELDADPDEARFFSSDHRRWAGCWSTVVRGFDHVPDDRLLSHELTAVVETAAALLPRSQRMVFLLRDVEGWAQEDVCNALELTDSNQRVLLHRARKKVRRALECYLEEGEPPE